MLQPSQPSSRRSRAKISLWDVSASRESQRTTRWRRQSTRWRFDVEAPTRPETPGSRRWRANAARSHARASMYTSDVSPSAGDVPVLSENEHRGGVENRRGSVGNRRGLRRTVDEVVGSSVQRLFWRSLVSSSACTPARCPPRAIFPTYPRIRRGAAKRRRAKLRGVVENGRKEASDVWGIGPRGNCAKQRYVNGAGRRGV